MKGKAFIWVIALATPAAYAIWAYEGQGEKEGPGNGRVDEANGDVCLWETNDPRVQYFAVVGSCLGPRDSTGLANGRLKGPVRIAFTPNGNVYFADSGNERGQYFTASEHYSCDWYAAVAPENGNPYAGDLKNQRIQYFTPTGHYVRVFCADHPCCPYSVAVPPERDVYVADGGHPGVQFFAVTGSYLGSWGSFGSTNGEFIWPTGFYINATASRIYVIDLRSHRVRYFNLNETAVVPASLGKVKALSR
jgi:DNA-binding beta-propeller fold protein YncE